MKFYILIAAFLLSVSYGFSQNKNLKCGFYGNKKVNEINKTFPFSANKIVLVAFPSPDMSVLDKNDNEIIIDSLSLSKMGFKINEVINLPSNDYIQQYFVIEKIELNQTQKNELSNLLINYKIKNKLPNELVISAVGCYSPRNAILFLDKKDTIISYIEVCFECIQFYQKPKETIPNFNILSKLDECSEMIGFLKTFFSLNGIKYGIENK